MRKKALIIYLFVVIIFLVLAPLQLLYGSGPGIIGSIVAGIGLVSCITSLIPFFVSRELFKKAASDNENRRRYRLAAIIVYTFCFPVKIWAICVLIHLLYYGEQRWPG
jgi:hypothetical protein